MMMIRAAQFLRSAANSNPRPGLPSSPPSFQASYKIGSIGTSAHFITQEKKLRSFASFDEWRELLAYFILGLPHEEYILTQYQPGQTGPRGQ